MSASRTHSTVCVERALVTRASSLIYALWRFAEEGDGVSISEYLRCLELGVSFEQLGPVAGSVAMDLVRSLEGPRW